MDIQNSILDVSFNYGIHNFGIHNWVIDISITEKWISIFGYEYLEFTTIVDIHNSVMESPKQLWIS